MGTLVRVEGLLTSDRKGNFSLTIRSGAGDYSDWDCVVLREIPWTQKLFLPSRQSDDLQARSFQAIGKVAAADVTVGCRRHCLVAINVESIKRLKMSDELANRLPLRTGEIVGWE